MQKRKSFFNNELEQRFSLRKYTIGLCSVCLGFVAIGMGSQTVKADTVNNAEKSSAVQENKAQGAASANTAALVESKTNTSDLAKEKPNTTPTETKEDKAGSVAETAPKTNATSTGANANTTDSATPTETKLNKANPAVANSNNSLAQSKLVVQPRVDGTAPETKPNEHGSDVVNPNAVSPEVKPNAANPANLAKIKLQKIKLAKLVDTKALAESKVATDTQFNFDDWDTEIDDTYLNITGYKGDRSKQIVVPNGADFAKAGKNDKNLQVAIDKDTLAGLIVDGVAPKLSNTNGQKIVANGSNWSYAFYEKDLYNISGLANLDTSNVTDMSSMFNQNRISDLSSLANWNTGKVTDMSNMFDRNQISDLSPLAGWSTGKVTDMSNMFGSNQISDLSPLANWNTGNVTDMNSMFEINQINDLSPLVNWDTNKVTNMRYMFFSNQISDLSPLANWNTDKVTNMDNMFYNNQISDLSPLANWNTDKVTSMGSMFEINQISDLSPLANWNTDKVTNMDSMFRRNQISNLDPLANWNTDKVTSMGSMFDDNQISDLSPLANWNTNKVTDMNHMFEENKINDLSPLANWNTGKVTSMSNMFYNNQISDLSPLANWNTGKVTDMDSMFYSNPLNSIINSQSTLNKFHALAYKLDNISTLASHSESKTFNDGSQILLDKNVITEKDSATLTFKANSSAGNTYQIKIYNSNKFNNIQVAPLPTALGTTDTSYQNGYTIITNKFINNGSVKQDISITQYTPYPDRPNFAQYESTAGLITVVKDKEDLGSINITYQNVADISNQISAPYIGNKPYINHTQSTFYFQPRVDYAKNAQYSFIKSAGLTITVPDDVTIDPDTFIDAENGKTLKATKIADNQYQVVLNDTIDGIAVKGLINVPADKLTNGAVHLPGFGMKYTIHTYNDKVAPLVATGTSKELSIIPDLASYHGALIAINQSKWAFDRNGNKVDDYTSQGFTNEFDYNLLNSAISTQITNGVETFDMPTGINITNFRPKFNKDSIDHIDYIYTDGSKHTTSYFGETSNAIHQMKVYFKNGIQSDELGDEYSNFVLSFDATYPDGTPIKNFDTFKITGSFSCDELGSANNIDVVQVMLTPRQKLTDGMTTDTDPDELDKTPNASGNSISATIRNDGFQHQGHLTNPIFYFKYNDLMVPDLSEISASYDNQNKELGSIGLTNIDNNKIHSSIITDSTGQKFVKVQIDGEYYYGDSSDSTSDFNVHIPIINASDALTATRDWSWYILNNSDEAKTESTIQSRSQGNKPLPVTVDGNTLSVGGSGTWQIITAQGFASGTETQGNLNGGPGLASTQDDHQQDPTHFNIYDSIINATNDAKSDLVSVANLPSTQDGKSQFDVHMTGKASLINVMTGQTYDATITYSYGTGDNNFITGDQVTDWSKVKSIKVVPNGGAPSMTSLRLVVPVVDKTVYDDVGKTIYMSTMTYGEDKTNTNYTTKDGFAVPEKSAILPIIIKAGDAASAKLTVQGQATVHTLIHYQDKNGKDVYVKLADQDKTYTELQDTMKRSDYLQSDRDLTIADRGLLPTGMVINYNNPTIRNSNNAYAAGYANGAAAFDKTAKYDFDGDQVIFEGKMPEVVTKTHQAKETIHYVYRDGSTAKPDKVLTSITLKQTGYKNPFTGEITWNTSTTDTLNSVDSPEITGYIADQLTVPSYTVTIDSPDKEVTVTYDADNENADFTYFDDTTNSTLKVVNKSGKSNTAIGYTTTDEINSYEKQGYALVSDDTDGRSLNFDSLPTVDQHYMIHLKHKTIKVTSDNPKENGTVLPDNPSLHFNGVSHDDLNKTVTREVTITDPTGKKSTTTQTVTFTRGATVDEVTGGVTYADWSENGKHTFDKVDVPTVPGYTASQNEVPATEVTSDTADQTINISYTANEHQISIEYVDNATGKILKTDHVSGKTGQTVPITPHIPDGYELVSGQSVPSEVTVGADGAPTTVIKVQPQERSVTVKFVDDQSYDFDTSDHKKQVGQAITVTGRDGDTVNLNLTVPDKYQLADGQQLPTTYTFAKGSGDLKIHLVHKVVQLKATVDVKLDLLTAVRIYSNHEMPLTVTQDQWKQIEAESKYVDLPDELTPSVKAGTLTGHVNYDLVYESIVSFGDDWTSLNLGGQTYQLPNGDEIVNGVMALSGDYPWGKTLKEFFLKGNTNTDSDYANRPWHGYLSVNATTNDEDIRGIGLQAGLVGDESNALAKATGDRAATGIEMANKTIDLSWLQSNIGLSLPEINAQDGQVKYHTSLDAGGVYIPYVEKTVTRTINVTTPDGKTTTVKQTATLAKQVDLGKDAHPAWTTGEWVSYDVPTIPGYTASQSQVAKETVTGTTKDQTVNITYIANPQTTHVNYVDIQGNFVHTTTVNGQTNQTVDVSSEVPTGWKLVDGQIVPATITFGPDGHADTSVKIEHRHVTVTPDKPQTNGTKLPDNLAQSFHGVEASDLNKTVTRTIKVTIPDGQTKTVEQTAKLTRTADVDEVTGEVTYGNWTTGEWDAYEVPTVPGYTASQNEVPATEVTSDTKPSVVIIRYKAQDHTVTYHFVDENGKQQTEPDGTTPIADETVSGKTDDTVNTPKLPDGWVLDGDTLDSTVKVPSADKTINVKIKHGQVTVTHDNPVNNGDKILGTINKTYGDGLTKDDLNQQGTRTIAFNFPKTYSLDDAKKVLGNGDKYTQVTYDEARDTAIVIQTIHFTRDAVVDTVTGKVVEYKGAKEFTNSKTGEKSLWNSDPASGSYAAVKIPKISGYKSKLEHVKDQTQVTRRGLNFARYYMVNFMALPSNPNSNVPSEPAKTPGTNPGDAAHVDKPGEVDNKGQYQGNKVQDQNNKGQNQGGQKTDDHKGQTPSGNTDNTQKGAETKPLNNDQKPADNPNADNTKSDEDVNPTNYKFDGKKSGNDLDTKSSSKKSVKTVVNTTKQTALNGNDKGVTNMVTTVSTTGKASDSVAPKDNIANAGNGEVAGVRTVQAATVNGSTNVAKDLPHTGEKQGMIDSIFGALASGLGILGLAGAKHKKKED